MKGLAGPAYHFRTEAQWKQVSAAGIGEEFELDPRQGKQIETDLGCKPQILAGAGGDLAAVDERDRFFSGGVEGPRVGETRRLIAAQDRSWLLASGHILQIDRSSLQLLVDRPAGNVADIAGDGRGGLWLLADGWLSRMDSSGRDPVQHRELDGALGTIAFAGGRLAMLDADRQRLDLLDGDGAVELRLVLAEVAGAANFIAATRLDGGERSFLLRYSRRGENGAPEQAFLLLGAGGDLLANGRWLDGHAPKLLATDGDDLLALFQEKEGEKILRFEGMADPGSKRRLTPPLETESPSGTWHRAEIAARLPERTSLQLRWASTADPGLARLVETLRTAPGVPVSKRIADAAELLIWSNPFVYSGGKHKGDVPLERFAFPLHGLPAPFLWIEVTTRRGAAAEAPEVESLVVVHEARSLMDDLPAIYRADEGTETVSPLRRLVGVLEAGVQEMDQRIASVAGRLDPLTAAAADLPQLASLLSLPFHDALSDAMRRALVQAAPGILAGRGTRAGLLALLRALFPNRPIQVDDRAELHSPMTLGRGAAGRTLPALLSGPSARAPRLSARLVLGRTGLCATGACGELNIVPAPQVVVTIAATGGERRRYAAAVRAMAEAMVPAGVELRLRWSPWRRRDAPLPDDVITVLDAPEPFAIGQGDGLGKVRVGGRTDARLDSGGTVPAAHGLL
jgi:phage tail-like protein